MAEVPETQEQFSGHPSPEGRGRVGSLMRQSYKVVRIVRALGSPPSPPGRGNEGEGCKKLQETVGCPHPVPLVNEAPFTGEGEQVR